jgi:hypothetical protein
VEVSLEGEYRADDHVRNGGSLTDEPDDPVDN